MNHKTLWAFALTSAAAFMVTLDNLVVTTAIPVIRRDLHAGIGGLEWTVNAYTLVFAVLLLTGAAIVMPLTLTILSASVPAERRGLALGAWGGISGLAIAFGPLVGGAVVDGISWHWIFWLNVPVGLLLIPLALTKLQETYGPSKRLDLRGLALASTGLFGIVWGLVRGNQVGWGSAEIVGPIVAGVIVLAAFAVWE